ncbi:DsbA family protein [Staphylococcus equorum]|uniref:DsbA family protein n=1 Tax=Staphylococcus equorum TaxID=246432 RepID=UPI002DB73ACB|nr:DsbA family protein [Staphylococcus equorum]MEB8108663.1 DsbA family protein [Staphylococcus equorum]
MEKNMVCDMYSGICKPSEENEIETINFDVSAPNLTLYYVTDPMCSHCWAFEPTLNKLLVQYGHLFNFQMVMGGLLEEWGDGTIMEIDPVQSSFPASRLYKAIQHVDSPAAAIKFTRLVREAVFVFNKNISDKAVLKHIVEDLYKGDNTIDVDSILNIADSDIGQNLLAEDFNLVSQLGVRGFPTIVIVNKDNQGTKIVGARSLETYIDALEKLDTSTTIEPNPLPKFSLYLNEQSSLFSKEIEVMYDIEEKDVPNFIDKDLDKSKYTISNILGENYYEAK